MRETVEELATSLKEEIATCCKRTLCAMIIISVMAYFTLMCCFFVEGLTSDNQQLGISDYYSTSFDNVTNSVKVDITEALTNVTETLDGMVD